jgi:hypothetical protein
VVHSTVSLRVLSRQWSRHACNTNRCASSFRGCAVGSLFPTFGTDQRHELNIVELIGQIVVLASACYAQ